MSAEKHPPLEDAEGQVAATAIGELSAAKGKSEVEDTDDGAPRDDLDDEESDDDADDDDADDDDADDDDADDDDDEDDDDDDEDESDDDDADDDDSDDDDSDDDDADDDDSDDDADDDEGEDESDDDDDDEDDEEEEEEDDRKGIEIGEVAAGAAESPTVAVAAPEALDASDLSDDDGNDNNDVGDQEAAGPEANDAPVASEEEEIREVAAHAIGQAPPELADGSVISEESEARKEIEEVVAEAVEMPVAVAAAPPPQVTDVVSSDHVQNLRLLEALLFAGTQALDEKALADRLPSDADLPHLLADLAELYANRGINLVKVAGGYAFRTASDLSEKLKIERPVTRKLSRASVETLAIIAFHQPVTRAEIEQVRGVGLSKGTLDLLFEQNWIKPMGRRRAPGKPVTWGTTDFFLEHFGLPSLDALPGHEEMRAAGLLDARAQPPIFRPEEPDLPLESTEEEAVEPLAVEENGIDRATGPQ